jgi:transcriptional regulator with XRE-family HTH domain
MSQSLATHCYSVKQPIALPLWDDGGMDVDSSIQTLAANLAHYMEARGVKQKALAAQSGVGQTTISLYLNPKNRLEPSSGSSPSPTLVNIVKLAAALDVRLCDLLELLGSRDEELVSRIRALVTTGEAQPVAAPRKRSGRG